MPTMPESAMDRRFKVLSTHVATSSGTSFIFTNDAPRSTTRILRTSSTNKGDVETRAYESMSTRTPLRSEPRLASQSAAAARPPM